MYWNQLHFGAQTPYLMPGIKKVPGAKMRLPLSKLVSYKGFGYIILIDSYESCKRCQVVKSVRHPTQAPNSTVC
jgi:hypothetical protein